MSRWGCCEELCSVAPLQAVFAERWMTCMYFRGSSALVLLMVLLHCARGTKERQIILVAWFSKMVMIVVFSDYITFPFIYFCGVLGAV